MTNQGSGEFERAVSERSAGGLSSDMWHLLKTSKKWWLGPLFMLLLLLGALTLLAGTAVAPFIYTIF
jgi:hypothetical protein